MRNQVENYYGSLDVTTEKFLFFAFTHMPGESYCRRLSSFVVVLVLHISSAN